MGLEFLKSQKGNDLLVADGCTFRSEKVWNGKTFWKCTEYRKQKCRARCHTQDDTITARNGEHNHVPNGAKIDACRIINELKSRALDTQEGTHLLVANASAKVNEAVAGQLPSVRSIKDTIRRIRHRILAPLPTLTNFHDLTIHGEFLLTQRGDNFLLHDTGPGKN